MAILKYNKICYVKEIAISFCEQPEVEYAVLNLHILSFSSAKLPVADGLSRDVIPSSSQNNSVVSFTY